MEAMRTSETKMPVESAELSISESMYTPTNYINTANRNLTNIPMQELRAARPISWCLESVK
jgi:hypothetical protein